MGQNNILEQARLLVEDKILESLTLATKAGVLPVEEAPDFVVEIPGDTSHGDFASNFALAGARVYKMAPPKLAQIVLEYLNLEGTFIKKASMAGPGFLNFTLDHRWFSQSVLNILALGNKWGETDYGQKEKVMVEFVSANPTGPMHLGNARGGVIGDSLGAALNAAGYDAHAEFYLNDSGNQIERFASSLEVRYLQLLGKGVELPEDGYQGEDITLRAQEYLDQFGSGLESKSEGERQEALIEFALPLNIKAMKETLEEYRIVYDTWFAESTLYTDGTVDKILSILKEAGRSYEKEGAIWYKSPDPETEKDEVLIRQNGNPTYFAADIAYHYNKFVIRGYSRVINIWGADHHGHVARIKGSMDAVGIDGNRLDIVLMQLVRLLKNGEPYRMSKRGGKSVTLGDLLKMVPVDAARFFFNMREAGSAMDFDLDLAVEQSSNNPVYYVQYAHARICSLMKKLEAEGVTPRAVEAEDLQLLTHPSELALIRTLSLYPNIIIGVCKRYDTASLTHYATEIASAYHKFYNDCRVLVEDQVGEEKLMQARISLCQATEITLKNLLGLLKITAPESM